MSPHLDALDLQLLTELQHKADRSNAHLAQKLGVSASTVHRRVQELRGKGIIAGVVTVVNPEAFGRNLVFVVSVRLSSSRADDVASLRQWIQREPRIQQAFLMPEDPAIMLTVRMAMIQELKALLDKLQAENDCVAEVSARVALETIKQDLFVPAEPIGS